MEHETLAKIMECCDQSYEFYKCCPRIVSKFTILFPLSGANNTYFHDFWTDFLFILAGWVKELYIYISVLSCVGLIVREETIS